MSHSYDNATATYEQQHMNSPSGRLPCICVTGIIYMQDMTHSYVTHTTHSHNNVTQHMDYTTTHQSFFSSYVTVHMLLLRCHMNDSWSHYNTSIFLPSYSFFSSNSYICVTPPIHICNMTDMTPSHHNATQGVIIFNVLIHVFIRLLYIFRTAHSYV